MKRFLLSLIGLFCMAGAARAADPENTLYLDLKDGRVVIEMLPEKAPEHVKRIKELVRQGFYDGIVFHRVIEGFMAQTGDPTGTGTGGSGQKLKAEFNDEPHNRGAVSMARAGDPDSADSQFFIVLADSNFLDRQYTVWGRVLSGMKYVDGIKKGDSNLNGEVSGPDRIIHLRVAADVPAEDAFVPTSDDVVIKPAAAAPAEAAPAAETPAPTAAPAPTDAAPSEAAPATATGQ